MTTVKNAFWKLLSSPHFLFFNHYCFIFSKHLQLSSSSALHQLLNIFFALRLFAVGGRDGSSCLRSMESFDPHTNKWSMCAPMSKRRGGVGVATYNNFLYAVGGHDAPASNHCSRLSDCVERSVVGSRKSKAAFRLLLLGVSFHTIVKEQILISALACVQGYLYFNKLLMK